MTELDLTFLYKWQKDAIRQILEDTKGKYFIIKSLRQNTGKTFTLLNLLGLVAILRPGSVSMLVSPTFGQSQRCLEDLSSAYVDWIRVSSKGNCIVDFLNGSRIYFKSAEQGNSLRGFTVKKGGILCVDESCYVASEVFEILLPVVNKRKATVVMTSTPDRMSGTFYNLYMRGLQNDEKIVSLNWSEYLTEVYTQEELDFYKSIYSARRYRTEILGEFSVNSGTVFSNLACCIGKPKSDSQVYYCGIDWSSGSGKDYTAITILNEEKEVVYFKMFNDVAPMDQVDFIKRVLVEYKPRRTLVEGNSIGSIYYDALVKGLRTLHISKFQTSNESKCKIVDQLAAHLEQEKITIPDNEELLRELQGFEEQTTKSGLRTYNCPPPLHDDAVISLCIALEAATSNRGQYSISIV